MSAYVRGGLALSPLSEDTRRSDATLIMRGNRSVPLARNGPAAPIGKLAHVRLLAEMSTTGSALTHAAGAKSPWPVGARDDRNKP